MILEAKDRLAELVEQAGIESCGYYRVPEGRHLRTDTQAGSPEEYSLLEPFARWGVVVSGISEEAFWRTDSVGFSESTPNMALRRARGLVAAQFLRFAGCDSAAKAVSGGRSPLNAVAFGGLLNFNDK